MTRGTCRKCNASGPLGGTGPDRIIPLINECGPCAYRPYPKENPVPPEVTR